ncbi:MAG: mechanosensitive ion channel [Crocinitomicaceae bacterium]|nr:mechanosensitive ion channel [Crocinitomicaceae bacterium]
MIDTILDKLHAWWDAFVSMLPNFVLSLIVLVLFIFLARYARKGLCKILDKTYKNKELTRVLGKVFYVTVIVTGLMFALSILKLDKTVTSVLAGAGIIGIALSFAFQDMAANLISGFVMAAKNPFAIGDVIEIDDITGKVKDIQLRSTLITTLDGNEVRIPNRILFENPLTNYFQTKTRRVSLGVGVSYAEDLEKVEKVTIDAIKEVENQVEGEEIQLIYTEFGDSSINLEVRYWVHFNSNFDFLKATSDGIKAIKRKYDEEGILIPFPIRTLDFGIKGGKALEQSLEASNGHKKEA